jgi:hypothetical protein
VEEAPQAPQGHHPREQQIEVTSRQPSKKCAAETGTKTENERENERRTETVYSARDEGLVHLST